MTPEREAEIRADDFGDSMAAEQLREAFEELDAVRLENQRLCDVIEGDPKILRMHMEDGRFDASMKGKTLGVFAAIWRDALKNAANYVEISFGDDLGQMLVTVQKLESPTPHHKRVEAERERDSLRSALATTRADLGELLAGQPRCDMCGLGIEGPLATRYNGGRFRTCDEHAPRGSPEMRTAAVIRRLGKP